MLNMLLLSVVWCRGHNTKPWSQFPAFELGLVIPVFIFILFYVRSEIASPPFLIPFCWTVSGHLCSILSQFFTGSRNSFNKSVSEFSCAAACFSSADLKRKSIGNLRRWFSWDMIPGTMLVRRNKKR